MNGAPLGDGSVVGGPIQCARLTRQRQRAWILLAITLTVGAPALFAQEGPRVVLETALGSIVIGLDSSRAPVTVTNFLTYVDAGFYDGLIFHRVIRDVMIQAGLMTASFEVRSPVLPPIRNEATNRSSNLRGTVAMARLAEPHSAEVQFFINVGDNTALDYQGSTRREWGYAVFGYVEQGMDIVDRIAGGRTTRHGSLDDFPEKPVVIYAAYRMPADSPH